MKDNKFISLTIGQSRKTSLDSASYCLAEGFLDKCESYINNFLQTIPDENGQIQVDLDKFYKISIEETTEMNKKLYESIQAQKINQYQLTQMRRNGENQIFARELAKRLEYVWTMAIRDGLFNAK